MSTSPVTLITGGSSGIGAAAARRLLERGHRVAVTGRSEERLARFAEEAKEVAEPGRLRTFAGDAADFAHVEAAVNGTVEAFGRLDHAVANAGFATAGSLADGDPEEWRAMVLTNVLGPALLVRAALPALRESRGRLVMVGSVAGFIHSPGNLYGATKWAVTGLAENTRRMVTDEGVGVTLVAPGRVETPFWENSGRVPEGNVLSAEQIADALVWSLSQPPNVDVNTLTVRPVGQPV
ncbi:SDR family oxidoreductase [Streptomyces albiaxialis]|uniref:SDR family oxidoreductase n=1 Tax=Streptomyces albiaxialis TaxID=329523 RepID=A0ABN2VUX1_9ACTN